LNNKLPKAVGEIKVVRLLKDSKADERIIVTSPEWHLGAVRGRFLSSDY
jgi:hypothetical protein